MKFVLLVEYDGTHFCGFQRQAKGERTVQGELERTARQIFGRATRVLGSGRTDAGVHALGQVCELEGETTVPPEALCRPFNCLLPPDLKVLASAAAPEDFDCTRHARTKTYLYTVYRSFTDEPLLSRYAVRVREKPDVARMREGASLLTGEHDFKAFSSTGSSAKTSVRTVSSITVEEGSRLGRELYSIRVEGNGFLYNMVRILAGELLAIGYGKELRLTQLALETGERSLVAKTMPAQGLLLEKVDYGIPLFGGAEEE